MANRDFWAKPIQSDRTSQDYGHTHLGEYPPVGHELRWWHLPLAGALFVIGACLVLPGVV